MSVARFNLGQSLGIDPGGKQRAKVAAKMSAADGTGPVGTGPRPGTEKPAKSKDAKAKLDQIMTVLGVTSLDAVSAALMDLLSDADEGQAPMSARLAAAGWSQGRIAAFMSRRARR